MAIERQNHYAVLGLSPGATQSEIARAYREQSKRYHPDRNPGFQELATERLQALNEAYEVLNDPDRRADYDRRARVRFAEDSDFLRLQSLREDLDDELRHEADPRLVFIASILAYNAIHWQFEVIENFFARRGEASTSAPEFDQWAARARAAQANLEERSVAAQKRLGTDQEQAAIFAELDRKWHAVVRTMSPAFQDRFERFRTAQDV